MRLPTIPDSFLFRVAVPVLLAVAIGLSIAFAVYRVSNILDTDPIHESTLDSFEVFLEQCQAREYSRDECFLIWGGR